MRNTNTLQADNGTNRRYAKAYRKSLQSKPVKKTFVDRVKDEVNNYRDMRRTVDAKVNEFVTQAVKSGLGGGIARPLRERPTMTRASRASNQYSTSGPKPSSPKRYAPNVRAVANPRPTQRQSSRKTSSYK